MDGPPMTNPFDAYLMNGGATIDGPLSAFWHFLTGGGSTASYGPTVINALQELQKANPDWWPQTNTPMNTNIFVYGSLSHPIDTAIVALTLGQFRYTNDGTTISVTDTYAFHFSQSDHYGGTTYHNALLSWIPGSPYDDRGSFPVSK
jgi:hypothetical protein